MNSSWPLVTLGEVLTVVSRPKSVDPEKIYKILGAHWYAKGLYVKDTLTGTEIRADKVYEVEASDFVYNRLFAWKGSFAVATKEDEGCYVSNEFPCFVVKQDKADPTYLWNYFSRSSVWDEALSLSSGGTPTSRNRLREEKFLALKVPLPPVPEQRRIVARIEELSAKINKGRTLRQQAAEEMESILRAARGRHVFELRKHYADVPLGEICLKITDGPHVSPRYVEKGVPFVSVRNISESGLDFASAKFVTEADHSEFSKKAPVEFGDVLYTKGGTTGIARRVDTRRAFSIWVHVALLKLNRDKADGGFVEHMLNSPSSKEQAEFFTHGSSNRDLGLIRMAKIVFPLPPLLEQSRIVAELDALQSQVDALKKLQAETAAELASLLPSILDKAFKGEL